MEMARSSYEGDVIMKKFGELGLPEVTEDVFSISNDHIIPDGFK